MRLRRLAFLCLGVLSLGVISSCETLTEVSKIKDGTDGSAVVGQVHASNNGNSNQLINSWIHDVMSVFYLWGDNMPAKASSNLALDPDKYFLSIRYQPNVVDRFSWIEEDGKALRASLGGVATSTGANFQAFFIDQAQTKVFLSVRYVVKNSPAEKAGIQRGDIFTKINGTEPTSTTNASALLASESLVFTYGASSGQTITTTDKTVTVTKAVIQNDPVYFSKVFTKGSKKIGYLVYNQFISGVYNSTTQSTGNEYDNKLRTLFADFKAQNINEFILDLRYNGGGSLATEEVVGSLLVKGLKPGTIMNKTFWSKNGESYARRNWGYTDADFMSFWRDESSNIGNNLTRIYILTSRNTASASEMLINDLKPYMDVILVGANTIGKDVGSITLDDATNNYRWKWAIQPIVLRFVNSKDQSGFGTEAGFTPTIAKTDNILPWKAFGDESETLLYSALNHITGNVATTAGARTGVAKVMHDEAIFDNKYSNVDYLFVEPKNRK